MLTSYAEELWIPVSVTAETAQAAENAAELPVQAPEAILMEASTGTILYEKNEDEARNPASVTKIMTLLLIFDALHSGRSRPARMRNPWGDPRCFWKKGRYRRSKR